MSVKYNLWRTSGARNILGRFKRAQNVWSIRDEAPEVEENILNGSSEPRTGNRTMSQTTICGLPAYLLAIDPLCGDPLRGQTPFAASACTREIGWFCSKEGRRRAGESACPAEPRPAQAHQWPDPTSLPRRDKRMSTYGENKSC